MAESGQTSKACYLDLDLRHKHLVPYHKRRSNGWNHFKAIVGPPCIYQHNTREAERRAHHDAFGANRGTPWSNPTNGG